MRPLPNQRRRHARRGFFTLVAVVATLVVILFATSLAKFAFAEFRRERLMALEIAAEQALQSARAWTLAHSEDLRSAPQTALPTDEILPPGTTAELTLLAVSRDNKPWVECTVRIMRSKLSLTRSAAWPLESPRPHGPAPQPPPASSTQPPDSTR